MTISLADVQSVTNSAPHLAWNAPLNSSSTTPLEQIGTVREDFHPTYGHRKFKYMRFLAAVNEGVPCRIAAPVTLTATAGTTTTFTVVGATSDLYNGWFFKVLDDAGGAGAAPEGEAGQILKNTATLVTLNPDDELSAALAVGDTVQVWAPWAATTGAASLGAGQYAGVPMADQAQYDYGWVQFEGFYPNCVAVAAGTAIAPGASVIVGAGPLITTVGAAALSLVIGQSPAGLASDQVLRRVGVKLCCGDSAPFGS